MSRTGKFEIRRSSDGQFYFVLKAENGEIIARSERYASKQGARNGIDSVRRNAPSSEVVDVSAS